MDIYKVSYNQVLYEVPRKSVCDWENKNTLFCFDLLVKPEQKDSLYIIMEQVLGKLIAGKVQTGKKGDAGVCIAQAIGWGLLAGVFSYQ